ncbi:peroxisomal assembly protein, partial [Coemansia sp. RSA 2598]
MVRCVLFAGISVGGREGRNSCIVEITKEPANNDSNSGNLTDSAAPLCVASRSTWLAVGGTSRNLHAEDAQREWTMATVESVLPVELTEIVFGVQAHQYEAALEAQERIASLIKEQKTLYYRGRQVTAVSDNKGEEPILLQCLMCQPVSQGVVSVGSATRIAIVKCGSALHARTDEAANLTWDSAADETNPKSSEFSNVIEQWDLGAEWLILGNEPLQGTSNSTQIAAVELAMSIDHEKLVPLPYPGEDIDNRGYMSISTLAKQGIVSGSWVSVSPALVDEKTKYINAGNTALTSASISKNQRAIRIFGLDNADLDEGLLALPPLLMHNISSQYSSSPSPKSSSAATSAISVLIIPLGSPPASPSPIFLKESKLKHQPPFETARKITLAR